MLQVEMNASLRKETGKGAMRQLRMKGITPAVVYGGGEEAVSLEFETQPLFRQLLNIYGKNAIITLSLDDGSTKHVLIQDVQTDPIKDTLIHADFLEIDVNARRLFNVPITFQGTAKGVDLGGTMHVVTSFVTVESLPLEVPDEFIIDVSDMDIGDKIRVEVVEISENLKLISDPKTICVSVSLSKKTSEEEEEEVEEEATAPVAAPAAEEE